MLSKMKPQLPCLRRLTQAVSRLNRLPCGKAATALLGLVLWLAATAWAQDAALVKDIRPGGTSLPDYYANANGTLFFTADDGTNGADEIVLLCSLRA